MLNPGGTIAQAPSLLLHLGDQAPQVIDGGQIGLALATALLKTAPVLPTTVAATW